MTEKRWTDLATGKTYSYPWGFDTDDTSVEKSLLREYSSISHRRGIIISSSKNLIPDIKNVIFNNPATIVYWADGSKTVVKCQDGDEFDAEKGLTMAIAKKVFGNKGSYCNQIKKWVEPFEKKEKEAINKLDILLIKNKELSDLTNKLNDIIAGKKIISSIINATESEDNVNIKVELTGEKL